ncbi:MULTISPECIES: YoqO family protein [Bacillus]|uniref:YoqO family protein n=1 Tax=Bacillus TaxID=1386 RepID=UPI0023E2B0CD|nr:MULTISPECIES: YoqO family protein [Bacillus]MDY7904162.1 YoqO family protein [Bacillus sp. AG1]WES02263.1 YoqO family protein [Bacillus velezensis]
MNKTIGITGLIISIVVQSFSADDSLSHRIATGLLFVSIMIYNFEHAKDYSKKSLVILGVSFIVFMLGIYKILSITSDYFEKLNVNFGYILLFEIALIIALVSIAVNVMKYIANRLKKSPDGKEF